MGRFKAGLGSASEGPGQALILTMMLFFECFEVHGISGKELARRVTTRIVEMGMSVTD